MKLFGVVALGVSMSVSVGSIILVNNMLDDRRPQNLGKFEDFLVTCGIAGIGIAVGNIVWNTTYGSFEGWSKAAEEIFNKSPKVV